MNQLVAEIKPGMKVRPLVVDRDEWYNEPGYNRNMERIAKTGQIFTVIKAATFVMRFYVAGRVASS